MPTTAPYGPCPRVGCAGTFLVVFPPGVSTSRLLWLPGLVTGVARSRYGGRGGGGCVAG